MLLIIMTTPERDAVRGPGLNNSLLEPREIAAGPYVGKWAIGPEVLADPDHAAKHDLLATCPIIDIDIAEAWPPIDV